MIISVIIPTFNRSDMLRQAITAVCEQTLSRDQYELVIADNASTDDTRSTIAEFNKNTSINIKYVYESRPGLHWARHAGARAAQGKILVFIDDDCLPEPAWLANLVQAYEEFKPDAAGGKILIRWNQPPPSWVVAYESVLGRLDRGPQTHFIKSKGCIHGGNFSILRDRLFEIGGFNPDQVGDHLLGDGETGLCRKIHAAGWKMLWVPSAMVWHQQTVERNGTLSDLKRRFANNGNGDAYAYYRRTNSRRRHLLRCCIKAFQQMTRHGILALLMRSSHNNAYYHHALKAAYFAAKGRYCWRLIWSTKLRQMVMRKDWITES